MSSYVVVQEQCSSVNSEEGELHPHTTLADSSAVRFTHQRGENLKGENYSRRPGCGHPYWIFT